MPPPAHTHDLSRGQVYNTVDGTNWVWTIANPTVVAPATIMYAMQVGHRYVSTLMETGRLESQYNIVFQSIPIKTNRGACTVSVYIPNMQPPRMTNATDTPTPTNPHLVLVLDVWNSAGERPTKIYASKAVITGEANYLHLAMDAITECPFFPEILELPPSRAPMRM